MYDVIVIGAGPAGISAAIYAKRAGARALVLYYGESSLEKAEKIENYYGFEYGIDGKSLYKTGIKQAQNLDIELTYEEVLDIKRNDKIFEVETENKMYQSKTVIIATGNKRLRPNIKGVLEFEGRGISYCATCDGFFYKQKNVAIIGNGKYALKEAESLNGIVNNIIILTDGQDFICNNCYKTNTKKIKEIHGNEKISEIKFEDGSRIQVDGVFIAIGKAGGSDFAKKLGIKLNNDSIVVDDNMQTNIEGLFACGDTTGDFMQICKATYEGAKAGITAAKYTKKRL